MIPISIGKIFKTDKIKRRKKITYIYDFLLKFSVILVFFIFFTFLGAINKTKNRKMKVKGAMALINSRGHR